MESGMCERHRDIIESLSKKFAKQHHIPYDELLSIANERVFVYAEKEYDSSIGTEKMWVWNCVYWGLKYYCKTEYQYKERYKSMKKEGKEDEEMDFPAKSSFVEGLLSELSEEAGFVVRLVLEAPGELAEIMIPRTKGRAREALVRHLQTKCRWDSKQIAACFNEIQAAL